MASRSAWASSSCPTGRRTTTRTARETADRDTAPLTPRRRLEATAPRTQQAAEETNEPVVGHRDAAQRGLFAGSLGRSPGNASPPGGTPAWPTSRLLRRHL